MKVIIEDSWNEYGDADDIIQYCSDNNMQYQILSPEQISGLNNFFDYVFFCNTEIVLEKLRSTNCENLCPDTYDQTYKEFYNRTIEKVSLADIILTEPIFIKPIDNDKFFDGHVVKLQSDIDSLKSVHPNMMVYKSEVISIVAEYRLLIGNGKLYGVGHMKGQKININEEYVKRLVELTNEKFRCVDVGFTNFGTWIVVEINPMYSLDDYGIEIDKYMSFCIDACKWVQRCVADAN